MFITLIQLYLVSHLSLNCFYINISFPGHFRANLTTFFNFVVLILTLFHLLAENIVIGYAQLQILFILICWRPSKTHRGTIDSPLQALTLTSMLKRFRELRVKHEQYGSCGRILCNI